MVYCQVLFNAILKVFWLGCQHAQKSLFLPAALRLQNSFSAEIGDVFSRQDI
jgi:hypothetical protein